MFTFEIRINFHKFTFHKHKHTPTNWVLLYFRISLWFTTGKHYYCFKLLLCIGDRIHADGASSSTMICEKMTVHFQFILQFNFIRF